MKRILVVDDEPNIRELLKEELQEEGYEIDTAENGEEALKKFFSGNYDLVILDIEMPGISGLEVAGEIRKKKKDAKIILLTAYSHYRADLSSWAADEYVVKSFNFDELKEKVKKLLS
ncbi:MULTISPECIES: response regulator [Thermotoga]|jgi:two-component system response regulator|uniref:Response regulator receiver protein n=2 Tax=Thermotoga petrophila TaxID=93929 RepID=A5IML3_THEP1|nr:MULTISPECIES: response regulator [Thermotoga]MBZ4660878.1 response regulator receiver protein [Thermotoga sp.]ABQ47436.1 response regulator receiver protein [Thermotoga petrophila RKU-1]ACB09813.1 response regulator receiver protein [Thermotoga sp. RQ2]ADA67525.1 response regulator receiver protein [Thermotoga petrophila RKU-10]AIY88746.1 response regulator receiver protein [Thermotoga sp. Cell2]